MLNGKDYDISLDSWINEERHSIWVKTWVNILLNGELWGEYESWIRLIEGWLCEFSGKHTNCDTKLKLCMGNN